MCAGVHIPYRIVRLQLCPVREGNTHVAEAELHLLTHRGRNLWSFYFCIYKHAASTLFEMPCDNPRLRLQNILSLHASH